MNKKYIDYFLLLTLIAISGFAFFSGSSTYIVLLFLIAGSFFLYYNKSINIEVIFIILIFTGVELVEAIFHQSFSLRAFIGPFTKLVVAYFIVKIIGDEFIPKYINIIYILAIISLLFYSLSFIPGVTNFFLKDLTPLFKFSFEEENYFYKKAPNILVFTFDQSLWKEFRNSGPFWEPGGFAVFLILALVFNLIKEKSILTKKNVIIIITILTTVSTAGYIALFTSIISFIFIQMKLSKFILLPFLIVVSTLMYFQFTFLGEKISQNINMAEQTTASRFGSMLVDYNAFLKSPIIGWGTGVKRYEGKQYYKFVREQHRNNGLFGLLASYGAILTFLYFFWYYKSIKYYCMQHHFPAKFVPLALLIIFILGFSQYIFTRPFFFSFIFYFTIENKKQYARYEIQKN